MKQLYLLIFLISTLCKLSFAQNTNQAYIDSVLSTKFLDIDGKITFSGQRNKVNDFKLEIKNEDTTFYFSSDGISNKFKLNLRLGKIYTINITSQ